MTTQKQAVKAVLTSDAAWAALVPGGTFNRDDLGRLGLTPETAVYDASGHLLPVCVITWSTSSAKEVEASERRFFQLWFYTDSDWLQIDAMKAAAKALLHKALVGLADGSGLNYVYWADDGPDITADEMQGAVSGSSRYYLDFTRR